MNLSALTKDSTRSSSSTTSPTSWSPPASATYKLNFDGAAKGNPGHAGFGGIFRSHTGAIMQIFYGSLGKDTNNAAELEGLWTCICIAEQNHFFPLEVEGDSFILIAAAQRIQAGTPAVKVAASWRLLSRLESLEEKLQNPQSITFKHVRRTANKVADRLANQGASQRIPYFTGSLDTLDDDKLKNDCISLAQKDLTLPDAGDGGTC